MPERIRVENACARILARVCAQRIHAFKNAHARSLPPFLLFFAPPSEGGAQKSIPSPLPKRQRQMRAAGDPPKPRYARPVWGRYGFGSLPPQAQEGIWDALYGSIPLYPMSGHGASGDRHA